VQITFPYKGIAAMEIPDRNLLGVFRPRQVPKGRPTGDQVSDALSAPIGSPRLGSLVERRAKVLLLSDDFTRPTPVAEMLPPVLAELQAAGVETSDIKILIAPGTHRPMTDAERESKLGREALRQHQVFQHRWDDEKDLARVGETSGGLPIVVNRHLLDADLVVALGHIVPHRIPGFSGGPKIIAPGVTGRAPGNADMHWLGAQVPGRELLGVAENRIRHEIDEMGQRVGLRFIVNVVQGSEGHVAAVFAGDPIAAQRQGAGLARDIYGVQLADLADIVVVDSYPADVDFWQAGKAAYASELAVRPGGVVILVTPSPEGVARHHPAVLEFGVRPVAEMQRLVETGAIKDIVAAAIMALTAWVVKERATGIMVSPGIRPEDQRKIGFIPAASPQEALEMAFKRAGSDARVAVLHHGGEILPLVPAEAEARVAGRERIAAQR